MIVLHDYQQKLKDGIYHEWASVRNVLAVLPTGGGKSIVVSDIVLDGYRANLSQAVIAHRNELVTQMSKHLANRGIEHRIIGSKTTISEATNEHRKEFGRSFVNPSAHTAVIGVDTLISRKEANANWAKQIDRWIIDEAHHVLRENKWGKAVEMFPNAQGLGVTATPCRADGQGLGREYDGEFDAIVLGPSMRWLIENGYLSDYEIVCPQSDMHYEDSKKSKDGDWSSKTLKKVAKESRIVGDVVQNYIKYASGRKTIIFATDVETAGNIASRFKEAGIPAVALSGKTDISYRRQSIQQFRNGDVNILVNVDLFDEGFDVPDCEVCIMARPTASLGKYRQMAGRALRFVEGKTALIIDHVSNVIRHKFPDYETAWSLGPKEKQSRAQKDPDDIPLIACLNENCLQPFPKFMVACPYCGTKKPLPEPKERSVEMVDGDLVLLDRATLASMRAKMVLEDPASVGDRVAYATGNAVAGKAAVNKQMAKIKAHADLKHAIQQWAGIKRHQGHSDREIDRMFYITTGIDVLSALSGDQTRKDLENRRMMVESWYS